VAKKGAAKRRGGRERGGRGRERDPPRENNVEESMKGGKRKEGK
jgi:hypothetical protein